MSDFELTPEERKHIAEHLMAPSYPRKENAELTVSLLLRLGYSAKVVEADLEEPEYTASCRELE